MMRGQEAIALSATRTNITERSIHIFVFWLDEKYAASEAASIAARNRRKIVERKRARNYFPVRGGPTSNRKGKWVWFPGLSGVFVGSST